MSGGSQGGMWLFGAQNNQQPTEPDDAAVVDDSATDGPNADDSPTQHLSQTPGAGASASYDRSAERSADPEQASSGGHQPVASYRPAPSYQPSPSYQPASADRLPEPDDPTPRPAARPARIPLAAVIIGVLLIGLIVGGGVAWLTTRPTQTDQVAAPNSGAPAPTAAGASEPSSSASESSIASGSVSATASSPPTVSAAELKRRAEAATQAAAKRELGQLADSGLDSVSLDGQPAAMIASKWVGIRDPLQETRSGSHVFQYADILAEHNRLAAADNLGADVILLRSTDYGRRTRSPKGKPLFVTLAVGIFSSRDDVQAWCDERFADLSKAQRDNSCVATNLTE